MILNEIQKQEIADYVKSVTRYMETYDEVYDHILSSLSASKYESFNLGLVFNVIDEDFGGIEKLKEQEEGSQKSLYRKFHGDMIWEIVKTLKSSESLGLLVLGCIFYYGGGSFEFKRNIVLIGIVVLMLTPVMMFLFKVCIKERRQIKRSISNYALRYSSFFGMNVATSMFFFFLTRDAIFTVSSGTQFIVMLGLCFFLSVYLRAYLKVCRNSLKLKRS
jgi:hypothetical protein